MLAEIQIGRDYQFMRSLVTHRQKKNLTVEDVAVRMGMTVESVEEFEREGYDPSLSEIRRYAHAVGVRLVSGVSPTR